MKPSRTTRSSSPTTSSAVGRRRGKATRPADASQPAREKRVAPIRIAWKAALAYLFVLFLVYLAGYFVSRIFSFLYLLLLFLPLLELLQVLATLFRLRFYQHFDNEHPVKGETIAYRLALANESPIASAVVSLHFKTVHPAVATELHDLRRCFAGNETYEERYAIRCPYRGIYTVGLESIAIRSLSGWIEVLRPAYHRTFYVYPRIITLTPPFVGSRSEATSGLVSSGLQVDRSLFEGLVDYRAGLPVRDIAWRKYLSTGLPFLKEYRRSSEPGITIYLDLRRREAVSPLLLEREDCSVEVVVALVHYFVRSGVPVTVRALARDVYTFHSARGERFAQFHHETINLLFGSFPSPVELFRSDRRAGAAAGSILFVTHLPDPDILDLVLPGEIRPVGAIVNLHGLPPEARSRYDPYFHAIRERGGRLILVQGADTIREDIEG